MRVSKTEGWLVIGQDVHESSLERVPRVVQRTKMAYRVALDGKPDSQVGTMAETWLERAGIPGVPAAFLVDKQGRIAFIDNPDALGSNLIEEVLGERFDLARAAKSYAVQLATRPIKKGFYGAVQRKDFAVAETLLTQLENATPREDQAQLDYERLVLGLHKKDLDRVYELAQRLQAACGDSGTDLNYIAQLFVAANGLDRRTLSLAEHIATQACSNMHDADPDYLATLAALQFRNSHRQEAIATQQKAVALAEETAKAAFAETLDSYKAGKLPPDSHL
jgi:hypothetical protein